MTDRIRHAAGTLLCLLVAAAAAAQGSTETIVLARTATDRGAYHYLEVFQDREGWIAPDIGYIDFNAAGDYREFFVGGGRAFHPTPRLAIVGEAFIDKPAGTFANGALYLMPWMLASYRFTDR